VRKVFSIVSFYTDLGIAVDTISSNSTSGSMERPNAPGWQVVLLFSPLDFLSPLNFLRHVLNFKEVFRLAFLILSSSFLWNPASEMTLARIPYVLWTCAVTAEPERVLTTRTFSGGGCTAFSIFTLLFTSYTLFTLSLSTSESSSFVLKPLLDLGFFPKRAFLDLVFLFVDFGWPLWICILVVIYLLQML